MQSPSRPGHWKISAVFQQILRGKGKEPRGISVMKPRSFVMLLTTFLVLTTATHLQAQKIKIIVDQDARGPATTDMQSILIFLQSDKFDVLGITTVSGDQWVKEETQRTLRLLEIANRTDVPVAQGAEFPLLNSKEEAERWEALYGKFRYKGCWSDFSHCSGEHSCLPSAPGITIPP